MRNHKHADKAGNATPANDEAPTAGTDRGIKDQQTHADSRTVAAMREWGTPASFVCAGCERESTAIGGKVLGWRVGSLSSSLGICHRCASDMHSSALKRRRIQTKVQDDSQAVFALRVADLLGHDPCAVGTALVMAVAAHADPHAAMQAADRILGVPLGSFEACMFKTLGAAQ